MNALGAYYCSPQFCCIGKIVYYVVVCGIG
jgi:hypothetical protein